MGSASPSYRGHRYPVEVISHCVWLYFRFPLSFREVEELMLQRGVIVSYETVRRWCAKFGQAYANGLRRRRPRPEDKWQGKAGPISMPRLERSTTRPASIETRAATCPTSAHPPTPAAARGRTQGRRASVPAVSTSQPMPSTQPARRQTECAYAPDYPPDHGRSAHYNTSPGAVC